MSPAATEGELRELVDTSDERWSSLATEGNAWQDRLAMRRALGARRGRFASEIGPSTAAPILAQSSREQPWRLWRGGPALLRSEYTIGREFVTVIGQGPRWWRTSPTLGTTSGSGAGRPMQLLLGPPAIMITAPSLMASVQIESIVETTALGREALRVRAIPADERPRTRLALRAAGAGAQELQLLVDRERGVLVGVVAFFDGAAFQSFEATAISFDETLDSGLFAPERATGDRSLRRAERLDLERLAAVASFPVFVPDPAPGPTPPYVSFIGGERRIAGPERAVIVYALSGPSVGRGQLRITESALPLPAGPSPQGWSREQDIEWREDHHGAAARNRVRTRRGATYVEIESSVLDVASLIALARSLVAVTPA